MAPPTNQDLNAKRERQCISITPERKYYRCSNTWVKRSLRPTEWQKHGGFLHVPTFNLERVLNEGACLKFLAERTDIPLPKLYACFEDDGAAYLITEYVEGVGMNELAAEDQKIVVQELEKYIKTLKVLTSNVWGGPSGLVLPPYRIMRKSNGWPWLMRPREKHDLVFCHNDLSSNNVIVDPATLKIKAIVDWEYGGFFPPEFEKPFYLRAGPSVVLPGEIDDIDVLTNMMNEEKL
ncbi:Protein kinase-like domain protein [Niveomyces insectorum RCEF 264]|uniref:Protein kinase-like domain protein n=1 Tax=Niveomyces insectorum RCEF 264 TaxID=1081102 RepID=A0A167W2B9_9HYPO|nr:Protein kinase-like domain protein [Niveomyces insectorum RCEF 264]